MIAIGSRLKQQGYEVIISLAEPYLELAQAAGLQTENCCETAEFDRLLSKSNVWKPVRGLRAVVRWAGESLLPHHFDLIQRKHRPGKTVLVSHPLDFASRLFRDIQPKTPLVDVHLAPVMLRVPGHPPRLTSSMFEFRRPQFMVDFGFWLADKLGVDPLLCGPLNRLRKQHGLSSLSRPLKQWWLSPDRIVAMYPSWFAPETEYSSPRLVHAGFPLQDLSSNDIDSDVRQLDRPIVFTAGTANHHCRTFFQNAALICSRLGHDGILLSTHPGNFPSDLPPNVRSATYMPLRSLLPHCGAIVHHGGIGTTSQAFAAAVPQIIRPMAFDQFDNATRVQENGCGVWLRRESALQSCLERSLAGEFAQACQTVASRFNGNAVESAVHAIDSLVSAVGPASS